MEPRGWGLTELRPLFQGHPARKRQGSRVPYSDAPRAGRVPLSVSSGILRADCALLCTPLTPEFEMSLDMKAAYPSPYTHALVEKEQDEKRKGGGSLGPPAALLV